MSIEAKHAYLKLTRELFALSALDYEGTKGDELRDKMDLLWWKMTGQERTEVGLAIEELQKP